MPAQAVEGLEGEADTLKSQLSHTLSLLQEQRSSLKHTQAVAAAREEELLGRCSNLEARLKAAIAQRDADAAELSKERSDAAEVYLPM